jgi:hypothetical protein
MYFLLPDLRIQNRHVQFTEKKKNMIIDGQFSKIVFASPHFIMNGMFFHCRIMVVPPGLEARIRILQPDHSVKSYDEIVNRWENDHYVGDNVLPMYPYKTTYRFDPNLEDNRETVVHLCVLEEQILEYYKEMHGVQKTAVYNLKSSLLNGTIKIHEESDSSEKKTVFNEYVLKISGVWETKMNVGLTFKFMYIRESGL